MHLETINYVAVAPPPFDDADRESTRCGGPLQMNLPYMPMNDLYVSDGPDDFDFQLEVHCPESCSTNACLLFFVSLHTCGLQNGLKMDSGSHWFFFTDQRTENHGRLSKPGFRNTRHTPTVCLWNRWLWNALESDSSCVKGNYPLCVLLLFPERTKTTFVMSLQLPAHPHVIGQSAV